MVWYNPVNVTWVKLIQLKVLKSGIEKVLKMLNNVKYRNVQQLTHVYVQQHTTYHSKNNTNFGRTV
jgi:hypothetical protein